jgi:hypothetical protein
LLAVVCFCQSQIEISHKFRVVHNTVRNSKLCKRSIPFKFGVTLLGSINTWNNENVIPIFKRGSLFIGDGKWKIS